MHFLFVVHLYQKKGWTNVGQVILQYCTTKHKKQKISQGKLKINQIEHFPFPSGILYLPIPEYLEDTDLSSWEQDWAAGMIETEQTCKKLAA